MTGQDDGKRSFGDRLRAARGAVQDQEARTAQEAERAFAPLLEPLIEMAGEVDKLNDPQVRMHVSEPEQDSEGFIHVRVNLHNHDNGRGVTIKYGPAMGGGYMFWVEGLDEARDRFKPTLKDNALTRASRPIYQPDYGVAQERASELAKAIEEISLKFYSK